MNKPIEIKLTAGQRIGMEALLRRFAHSDFRGALVAHISTTGQSMKVVYVDPPERAALRRVLEGGAKRVKAKHASLERMAA